MQRGTTDSTGTLSPVGRSERSRSPDRSKFRWEAAVRRRPINLGLRGNAAAVWPMPSTITPTLDRRDGHGDYQQRRVVESVAGFAKRGIGRGADRDLERVATRSTYLGLYQPCDRRKRLADGGWREPDQRLEHGDQPHSRRYLSVAGAQRQGIRRQPGAGAGCHRQRQLRRGEHGEPVCHATTTR